MRFEGVFLVYFDRPEVATPCRACAFTFKISIRIHAQSWIRIRIQLKSRICMKCMRIRNTLPMGLI
jgi:hypothetical protein